MHKNSIKRVGRVNFWKKIDLKKPETRPEPIMSSPNPKKYFKTRPDPNPKKISKPEPHPNPTFGNPTHHYQADTIQVQP